MSKKKTKLQIAQEDAEKALSLTNKKIEELGTHTGSLYTALNSIQECFDQIRNVPSEKQLEYEKLKSIRLQWKQQVDKIDADFKNAVAKNAGAGAAGIGAGVAVAALGPTAAMGIATTFGVASTGTAISTLSGAAATNAALAWLGGGALAAGGGGMAAGNAFLALAGPIGWAIAGVLRFHEKLRWHEDNYFNTLCSYCEPQVVDLTNTPFYLWRYSASSVTRLNNHEYTFNSIDELLDARDLAYEVIIKDYKKNCARDILYLIIREYLVLIDPANRDKEKYLQIAKRYYDFVKKFTPDLIHGVYAPDLEAFILEVYKQSDSKFLPDMSLNTFLGELYKLFEAPPITPQPQISQGN